MVFHRSLTIFRQDWRGRRVRRAAAERKGGEVGAGSGALCPQVPASGPIARAPGSGRTCAGV
jgi:hypothetical protein